MSGEKPEGSVQIDVTQLDDAPASDRKESDKKQYSEKTSNCIKWSSHMLKTARIGKITQEYREYKDYKPNVKTTVSEKMADKNRYNHILCADQNRVVLKERDSANDYIHASWMEMPDHVQFISTQGPIKSTITDFWHMIYTEKCSAIVMLCQYVEEGQEKCEKYFSEQEEKYGDYRVKIVEKTVEPWSPVKYTLLQVQKKSSSTKHLVHHFWYHDWHDQVAPIDPAPMVKLYKTALKKAAGKPIVVHCSAGIGRTSTFVGIHLAFVMIRENATIEMIEILKKLRQMRLGSIQSQLQYVFLIVCIIQLFIDEKIVKKDELYEQLQKKYGDVTKRVTNQIVKQEQMERKKKEEKRRKELADAPSKGTKKTEEMKEMPTKQAKKDPMKEAPSRFQRRDETDEKTKTEKKSENAKKDQAVSLANKLTLSGKDRSKNEKPSLDGKKKRNHKMKRKPNIFGL